MIKHRLELDIGYVYYKSPIVTNWIEIGNTPNDYRDIRSNNYVRIEDGTLSIGNIQKSSEGYYLCEASNGIGAGLSAVIFVSVQGTPFNRRNPRFN